MENPGCDSFIFQKEEEMEEEEISVVNITHNGIRDQTMQPF